MAIGAQRGYFKRDSRATRGGRGGEGWKWGESGGQWGKLGEVGGKWRKSGGKVGGSEGKWGGLHTRRQAALSTHSNQRAQPGIRIASLRSAY